MSIVKRAHARPGEVGDRGRKLQAEAPRRKRMRIKQTLLLGVAVAAAAAYLTIMPLNAQVTIDADDIGGVVTGPAGPEAGVWVIAETTDLGTKMAKMVVTD